MSTASETTPRPWIERLAEVMRRDGRRMLPFSTATACVVTIPDHHWAVFARHVDAADRGTMDHGYRYFTVGRYRFIPPEPAGAILDEVWKEME